MLDHFARLHESGSESNDRRAWRHFQGRTISTIGLGSTISQATDAGNMDLLVAATVAMAAIVVLINRLAWRRMYVLAETKFGLES